MKRRKVTAGSDSQTYSLHFTYSETEVVNTATAGNPIVSQRLTASGSESFNSNNAPSEDCSATLSAAPPGPAPIYFRRLEEDNGKVIASPYLPGTADLVAHGSGSCSEAVPDDGDYSPQWTTAVNPTLTFAASKGSDTAPYPVHYSGTQGGGSATAAITADATNTLKVSLGGCDAGDAAASANDAGAIAAGSNGSVPPGGYELHATDYGVPFDVDFGNERKTGDFYDHVEFKIPGKWNAKIDARAAIEVRERRGIGKWQFYYSLKPPSLQCPAPPGFERYVEGWNKFVTHVENKANSSKAAFDHDLGDRSATAAKQTGHSLAKNFEQFWTKTVGLPWGLGPQ